MYSTKISKNAGDMPTEYQMALNEYQSAEAQRLTKSSRLSTNNALMTVPDEKAEYN